MDECGRKIDTLDRLSRCWERFLNHLSDISYFFSNFKRQLVHLYRGNDGGGKTTGCCKECHPTYY